MNNTEITEAAGLIAQEYAVDLENMTGSGANGRILKKDVEKAIQENGSSKTEDVKPEVQEEKVGVNASSEEVKAEPKVVVSVTEEMVLPVGDRVVMMMVERRTGLPIRQHLKMFGADPYFLTDGVVPVVAGRVEKKKNRVAQEAFNPALPEDVFAELFGDLEANLNGGVKPREAAPFIHRVGVYSFDGNAEDRLRFSRGLDDEFGRNDSERAIRHWIEVE